MRSAHDLDTRPDHWDQQAPCRVDPQRFSTTDRGHVPDRGALHMCHHHCPVRSQCAEFGQSETPKDRACLIYGGTAYGSRGQAMPTKPAAVCDDCPRSVLLSVLAVRHGSVSGVTWHRTNDEELCGPCRRVETKRDQQRRWRAARRASWTT